MRTIEQMVQQEVNCCLSSLVSTLAQAYGCGFGTNSDDSAGREAGALFEQAFELACPVLDYEETVIQAGWFLDPSDKLWTAKDQSEETGYFGLGYDTAEQLCREQGIDDICQSEVYEHWAVSSWLAEKLIEQGEKVDPDFAGLNAWARRTTGQQISADGVIERIYSNMMKGV